MSSLTDSQRPIRRLHLAAQIGYLATAHLCAAGAGLMTSTWLLASLPVAFAVRLVLLSTKPRRAVRLVLRWLPQITLIAFFFLDRHARWNAALAIGGYLVSLVASRVLWWDEWRDDWGIRSLTLVEIISAALFAQGFPYLPVLIVYMLSVVVAASSRELLGGTYRSPLRRVRWRLLLQLAVLFALVSPLTVGLFLLLPRTNLALSQMPWRWQNRAESGFGAGIQLGRTGSLELSARPALRIKALENDALTGLYWRGGSLAVFDGQTWAAGTVVPSGLPLYDGRTWLVSYLPPVRRGHILRYDVQVIDPQSETLFFAGYPELLLLDGAFVSRHGDAFRATLLRGGALHYQAWSFLPQPGSEYTSGDPGLSNAEFRAYLHLPPIDPRISQLARDWSAGASSAPEQARLIEQRLQSFGYTTEQLPQSVPDPLAYFLFERRKGHCEYFASAMAVMLRSLGLPSRVAVGYHGGRFNPITHLQVLRGSDAHAWVEMFVPGRGWLTFDPTPAVAGPGTGANLLEQWQLVSDAMDSLWQDWVLSYDLRRQMQIVGGNAQRRRDDVEQLMDWFESPRLALPSALPKLVVTLVALAIVLAALWWWRRRRPPAKGRRVQMEASRLYQNVVHVLRRQGLVKGPYQTGPEIARQLPDAELAELFERFVRSYEEARFGGKDVPIDQLRERATAVTDALHRPPRR